MKFQSLLSTTAIFAASLAFAPSAFAQTTGTENEEDAASPGSQPGNAPQEEEIDPTSEVELESGQAADEDNADEVVVTGTRIRRPNLDSNVPITSVSADELTVAGDQNIGDALNDLPSLRSTFSQANSTRFIGTAGLNFLDLRGLGTTRTLVLVNGRRHITASPGDFRIDVNTIPTDLIERVDIITGGSSAVYGSDAVAGVVNFVLKRDFDGFRIRGQGGVSSRGDRPIQFIAGVAGKNFGDGRGNVALNVEYVNAEPYRLPQRDDISGAFSGRSQLNLAEVTAGEPAVGDGIADNLFFRGVRNNNISDGGLINANITAAQCADPATAATVRAARCLPNGQPRVFLFDQNGNFVENVFETDFRPFGSNNVVGGQGATLRNYGQFSPGQDRYAANLTARFDVTDAFKPFAELKYVHLNVQQESSPSFFQGTFPAFFGGGNGIRCDNAFLTDQNLAQLRAIGRCTGTTAAALQGETIALNRNNVDLGSRSEENIRDTYRAIVGIQGDFNDDWNYEISGNYGRLETKLRSLNNLLLFDIDGNPDGFLLASDAVRNAQGQIVCRVNADADPTNDRPDCAPINLLGTGRASQAAIDFSNVTSTAEGRAEQYNAVAFVNGDFSQLFEFPGGPIRFVVGGEYRREEASQVYDDLTSSGATFLNALQDFRPPALEVYEGFGEIEFPLLRDVPLAQELTFTGAARYSDYNEGAGTANTTFAYNINGTWAPISDLRLRANYSKSVRVPTLGDLFSPQSQNFAFVQDPCDVNFINGGPNRAANCAAAGVPVGFINTAARAATIGFLAGGNPLLEEETGKSITAGAVITPRFLPGFSLTVDYFDIEVENLIAALGAQQILNLCFDQATINNQFCALINPRLASGEFADPNNVLTSGGVNFARLTARGVDADVAYRRTFDNGHRLNLRAVATYTIERTNFVNPVDPTFGDRIKSELGDPTFNGVVNAAYGVGNFDLAYTVNYIGRQITPGVAYEQLNTFQGRPPTNADVVDREYIDDVFYHAVRLSYKVNNNFRSYFGVSNLFDRKPPFGRTGTDANDGIFDNVGRFFYAGAQVDF